MTRQIRIVPHGEVVIRGQRRAMISADVTTGTEVQVAQGNITVDPRGPTVYGNDPVTIIGGYDSIMPTLMTGKIASGTISYSPVGLSFSVIGLLDQARHEIGTPPTVGDVPVLDEYGNPLPIASYANMDDAAIVGALLTLSGVAFDPSQIATAGWTMGTIQPVTLGQAETPFSKIASIDEVTGMRTFELPDGTVRRIAWTGKPAGAPGLILQQGLNLQEVSRTFDDLSQMYNRINVTGLVTDLGTPVSTIQADSLLSPSTGLPYIPTPPQYRAGSAFSSPLLETHDQVVMYGQRFIGEHNRTVEKITGRVLPPNPRLVGGMSAFVIAPLINLDSSSVFRIGNVHTQIGQQGLRTDLTLTGGFSAEGVDPNAPPVASFTITVIREHIAGQGDIFVIICDASASTDPEGAVHLPPVTDELGVDVPAYDFNGIFRYAWTSNLGVAAKLTRKGMIATFITDFDPTGHTVTLTVYDSQLSTGVLTKTIHASDNDQPLVRDLWLAVTSELLYTNDGERTWKHIAVPAVFVPQQCADDFTIALTGAGLAYRVTTLQVPTLIATAPTNATAAAIRFRSPDTAVPGDRCWIGTADGQVWFSSDKGLTFVMRSTIPGGLSITSIDESPYAEGDVYITAGNQIIHSYDSAGSWEILYAHPNTALLATKAAAGFEHMFVGFAGAAPTVDPGLEVSRIIERRNQVKGDWTRLTTPTSLPAGDYKVAFSYRGAGGETALSPLHTVTVPAGGIIAFPPVTPLIQGANGIYLYCSQAAGSSIMRRVGEGTGDETLYISVAPAAGIPPQAQPGNTYAKLHAPTVIPLSTAVTPTTGTVDVPAQPASPSIGVYSPILTMVGLSPDGAGHSWFAQADADFVFQRGEYPSDQLGVPADSYRDGFVENLVYVIGSTGFGKTTTSFESDCFRVLPLLGSQVGRKIGLGKIGPAPAPKADLTWIGFSRTTGIAYTLRATSGGFVNLGTAPAQTARGYSSGSVQRLFKLRTGVYMLIYGWTAQPGQPVGPNNLFVTTDDCASWQTVGAIAGALDANCSQDGTVYVLTQNSDGTGLLQVSTDDGTSWTTQNSGILCQKDGVSRDTNIMVDWVDSQGVWLAGLNSIRYSADGGVTFGAAFGPATAGGNDNLGWGVGIGQGGGAVRLNSGGINVAYYSTTSGGQSNHTPPVLNQSPFVQRVGQRVYVGSSYVGVFFSTDGGITYTDLPACVDNINAHFAGVGYDATLDEVYLAGSGFGSGTTMEPFVSGFKTLRGGVWIDQTPELVVALGDTFSTLGGLAVQ